MLTWPWDLRWRDVDPAAIAFDLAPARAISKRLLGGFRYRPQPGTTRTEYLERLEDRLGTTVADRLAEPLATADALEAWRHTRVRVDWSRPPHPAPAVAAVDGHLAYIETRDRARDGRRADRLREALQHMRVRAAGGEPLTMSLLAQCQQIVLGLDATPGFRIRDAYAKAGRERYSAGPEVAGHFDRCLEEANGAAPAAVARAARVYLDVCFFHPFEDGNARAARLALDHVLTCAGLRLTVADPIFGFSRWADDALDAIGLPWLIQRLARAVDTAAEGQAT